MDISLAYKDKDALHDLCMSQTAANELYDETVNGGKYDPTIQRYRNLGLPMDEPHWERKYYPGGFVEEFWEDQRCNS